MTWDTLLNNWDKKVPLWSIDTILFSCIVECCRTTFLCILAKTYAFKLVVTDLPLLKWAKCPLVIYPDSCLTIVVYPSHKKSKKIHWNLFPTFLHLSIWDKKVENYSQQLWHTISGNWENDHFFQQKYLNKKPSCWRVLWNSPLNTSHSWYVLNVFE